MKIYTLLTLFFMVACTSGQKYSDQSRFPARAEAGGGGTTISGLNFEEYQEDAAPFILQLQTKAAAVGIAIDSSRYSVQEFNKADNVRFILSAVEMYTVLLQIKEKCSIPNETLNLLKERIGSRFVSATQFQNPNLLTIFEPATNTIGYDLTKTQNIKVHSKGNDFSLLMLHSYLMTEDRSLETRRFVASVNACISK